MSVSLCSTNRTMERRIDERTKEKQKQTGDKEVEDKKNVQDEKGVQVCLEVWNVSESAQLFSQKESDTLSNTQMVSHTNRKYASQHIGSH